MKLSQDPMCQGRPFDEACRNFASTVHHKIPHRGDHKLFCDLENLESLCFACHDSIRGEKENQ
jgi:5-methylcytosine-specific restriction endonuclease McrA